MEQCTLDVTLAVSEGEQRELTLFSTSNVAEIPELNNSNTPITITDIKPDPLNYSFSRCVKQVLKFNIIIVICGTLPILYLTLCAYGFGVKQGVVTEGAAFLLANGTFMTLFYAVMVSLYSFAKMKFLIPYVVFCTVGFILLQIFVNTRLVGLYAIIVFAVLTQALWTNIKLKFKKMFYFWSQAPLFMAFIFFVINDLFLIDLYLQKNIVATFAVTIILYPFIFKILVFFSGYAGHKIQDTKTPQMYTVFAVCCRVYFARFFNTQLRTLYYVFISSVILSLIRLATKLVLLKQPTKNIKYLDILTIFPAEKEKDVLNAEKAQEIIGILFAGFSDIIYRATEKRETSGIVQTIEIMLIQYAVEIVLQLIFVRIELKNNIALSFSIRDKFIPVLIYSNWVVVCFVATRIVYLNYEGKFDLLQ